MKREAERFIALCLYGNPPLSIAANLRKLWWKKIKEINKLPENRLQGRTVKFVQ